jgi:LacI family xylobiose transport system transcriptional regulator
MTTIRQPLVRMAEAAAEMALAMARGDMPAQPRVELATELDHPREHGASAELNLGAAAGSLTS